MPVMARAAAEPMPALVKKSLLFIFWKGISLFEGVEPGVCVGFLFIINPAFDGPAVAARVSLVLFYTWTFHSNETPLREIPFGVTHYFLRHSAEKVTGKLMGSSKRDLLEGPAAKVTRIPSNFWVAPHGEMIQRCLSAVMIILRPVLWP